jgi:hypothetical protein
MTPTQQTRRAPTVVCELSAAPATEATLEHARAHCDSRGAELVVVWVIEPASFGPSLRQGGGGPGTFGLLGALALAREVLRRQGVDARVVVRIGERGRVLEDERRRLGAERVITAADVPPERCPRCGALHDNRAVHFCPRVHLERHRPAHVEPNVA